MSAVDTLLMLHRRVMPLVGRMPIDVDADAFRSALLHAAPRLLAFAKAFKTWRESECMTSGTARDFDDHPCCVGDNHLIDCPVEVARQDAIATFDELEGLQL